MPPENNYNVFSKETSCFESKNIYNNNFHKIRLKTEVMEKATYQKAIE